MGMVWKGKLARDWLCREDGAEQAPVEKTNLTPPHSCQSSHLGLPWGQAGEASWSRAWVPEDISQPPLVTVRSELCSLHCLPHPSCRLGLSWGHQL